MRIGQDGILIKEECKGCKYWLRLKEGEIIGWCRLNPPIQYPIPTKLGSLQFMHNYINTNEDQWCGKFETNKENEQ